MSGDLPEQESRRKAEQEWRMPRKVRGSHAAAPGLARLLRGAGHGGRVAKHARIREPVEFRRLLAGLDAAHSLDQGDHVLKPLVVETVVIGSPVVDVEQRLDGCFGYFFGVPGRDGVLAYAIGVFRITD